MGILYAFLFFSVLLLLEIYVFKVLFGFFLPDASSDKKSSSLSIKTYFRNRKATFFTVVYWAFIFALPVNMWLHFKGVIHPYEFKPWIYVNAVFFIFVITRITIALFSGAADLIVFFTDKLFDKAGKEAFDEGRNSFLKNMAVIAGLIPFPTFLYGMIRNPYRYRVRSNTIRIQDLNPAIEGLRIVQISDIHAGSWVFKSPVESAIEKINELDADIVCFTGDMVNYRASEMEPFVDLFSKIKSRYGVFSVLGNHDYGDYFRWSSDEEKRQNFTDLLNIHKRMGWKLLRNEHNIVHVEGADIAVIGVENYSALPQFPRYGDLKRAYSGTENMDFRLLLTHDPTHWDAEVRKSFADIELTLSGHTHGFQFGFEIPGFIRWSPSSLVYNQWAGLYRKKDNYLYVNRGLGFLGYPGRVGILPEITLIELKAKPDDHA